MLLIFFRLKQLISESTRITLSTRNLIHLIFTNQTDDVHCSGVYHVAINDHSLVYINHKISIPTASKGIK